MHHLRSRRYEAGDYAACDILIDLETAIEKAGLTNRQRQVLRLIYEEDLTQSEAAERLMVTQEAIAKYAKATIKRITAVYRKWEYGVVTISEKEVV